MYISPQSWVAVLEAMNGMGKVAVMDVSVTV
jgi:hypothetical protein